MRFLWPLLLLAGCRGAQVVPIDVVIRPKVGVEVETAGGMESGDWQTAVLVLVGIIALLLVARMFRRVK